MRKMVTIISLLVLISSCKPVITKTSISDSIRINQIGFYPNSVKQFVIVDIPATSFKVIDQNNKVAFKGDVQSKGIWEASGEEVSVGDFSSLKATGIYSVIVNDSLQSYSFEIKENVYKEALNAAIKSYYFQRSSMPIEDTFGGIYYREAGHMDNAAVFHPSSGHSKGTLSSVGGWYDAGDYGKYIVNATLSTGQMLQLVEQFPTAIPDKSLNIPESGNGTSDLLDELKYELDWILTMQDVDGGVFHKLTSKTFCGFVMPKDDRDERMIIGKGTAATLDFAAVLAQASRIFQKVDAGWSEKALEASEKAWLWAVKNNNEPFSNPADVQTGPYDDTVFSDDFYWAAAELFITTKKEDYNTYLTENKQPFIHELANSWKSFIRNNAFHSLLENKQVLEESVATSMVKNQLKLADEILLKITNNPYAIALDHFEWGSNSDILNQAMILCMAHRVSNNGKYLIGAEQITDYIFGKNATGYSFLTGFGTKIVQFPHHRPSGADNVVAPIPGFIVGGPNNDKQDANEVTYASKYPAKSYEDLEASYASNEVCINWNAPAVYVLGYLEQVRK